MVLRKEITSLIKDILKKNPQGLSITELVKTANINRNTAGRYLENLLVSGQVEMRRFGMAKIYMLSRRVPLSALLSISSDMVLQLDNNLRITFANEPFLDLIGTDEKEILGKNIEYTPIALALDELFTGFIENIRGGIEGKEFFGEITLPTKEIILSCRIAPTVFDDGRKGVSVIFEDITERKKAEKELRESQDRYRSLVEISPDAVLLHRDGKIIYANPATLRILGALHLEEVIGKNVLDFISPTFRDTIQTNIQQDLNGQISPRTELHMIRVDGTPIAVEGRGIGTIIDGKPAVQVAIKDITEQKRAQEALRKSEDLYRSLAESSTDLIFVIGRDDRVEYVNSYASALVDKPAEKIIGYPRSSLFPPEVAGKQKKALQKVFETGISVRNEGVLTFAGRIHWFDHFLTPLKGADNRVRSVLGISRDITERKRAEEALRESQGRLQLILDSTDDIIIMQDLEGKFLYFNSVSRYGISEKDTLGSSPYDFLDRENAERLVERVRNVAKTGQSSRHETSFVWKGQTLWFSDSLSPVRDSNGAITAVVTVSHNITERKRTEMALRESEATARALLNAPTDSVILIDDKGTVLAINEIAASRFGKRSEDLVGTMSYNLLPKEVAQFRRVLMAPILEKKESVRFVDERAGRWYDTVAYPILNETGDVKKIAIIARDITEQKNIEKQIRESEQLYQRLLEQSFDAIAMHKDNKIAHLNRRAVKFLGPPRQRNSSADQFSI